MIKLRDQSIRTKLMIITMLVSGISIIFSFVSFFLYDFYLFKDKIESEFRSTADIIGGEDIIFSINQYEIWESSSDSIAVGLKKSAHNYLTTRLTRETNIHKACVFDAKDKVFVTYFAEDVDNKTTFEYKNQELKFDFWNNSIELYQEIIEDNQKIATVYLQADLDAFYAKIYQYISNFLIIFIIALAIAYIISRQMQRMISTPIFKLADTIQTVSNKKDFSVRINEDDRKDELGTVIHGFNNMLREIETQNINLTQAKDLAENSAKAKEQFLANMSHEIRTPMNGVMGMADLLNGTQLNDVQQKYVNIIKSSADNLLVIINDILDISKIESGKLSFEESRLDVRQIIDTILASFNSKITAKNLKIDTYIDPQIPQYIIGDPVRLNQIILNLFSNAIKFTIEGGITLRVEVLEEDENSFHLKFSIQDTGIGIASDKFDEIFSSFTQASSDTTRKYGGTGLGLSISKKLVELQNGKMYLQSSVGAGSTFTFEIQFKKYQAQQISTTNHAEVNLANNTEDNSTTASKKRILLAEDNNVNQMLVVTLLNLWKYEVEVAENGQIAVDKLKDGNFQLVLMDVHMPEMDGYEATKQIRQLASPKCHIPIIAMTASALKGEAEKCIDAGMDDYISKPFDKNVFYEKLVKHLDED